MPRRYLGRTYPAEIQDQIVGLGKILDDLIAGSFDFFGMTERNVIEEIRTLNSSLVNEVIVISDKLSDQETKDVLGIMKKFAERIQAEYKEAGIERRFLSLPQEKGLIRVSKKTIESWISDAEKAIALFPEMASRYVELRPAAESSVSMPLAKETVFSMMTDLESRFDELGIYAEEIERTAGEMKSVLPNFGDEMEVDRAAFYQMGLWTVLAYEADQILQRIEGAAGKIKAGNSMIGMNIPLWIVLLLGGAAVTGILVLSMVKRG